MTELCNFRKDSKNWHILSNISASTGPNFQHW